MNTKFPYECVVKETRERFTPTMIDYDNEQVWWQQGQASGNGEWLDFCDVGFLKVETFVDLSEKKHI